MDIESVDPTLDENVAEFICIEGDEEIKKKEEAIHATCNKIVTWQAKDDELLGTIVHSETEAYNLYCDYAHKLGFSVRKGKSAKYSGTNNLSWKRYVCSKEGYKNDERLDSTTYSRPETRTGCPAMIQFSISKQGEWKVTRMVTEHNHEFVNPERMYLLRSARKLSTEKGNALISMVDAGVRTIDAYNYMTNESGGAAALGFSKKDCYNFVHGQKMALIEAGDSQSLVHYFKKKVQEEGGMFYWDAQLDEEGRMTNFFWRDRRCKVDYECFGDVVIFDTTYRTNRYNLICAPFVGTNHHWQNVMFGCAFLSNETTASFRWLFTTFLDSMDGQAPKTIFTDQDQAMANAIEEVFPSTHHRLCQWHISQNSSKHLGGLNSSKTIQSLFTKCMKECDSVEEFEGTWSEMIKTHNLEDHKWLKGMYNIRHKWSTAFNKDIFDGGIKASQRSESTNRVLNGIANKSTSLTKFVIAFEKKINGWRRNEAEEDCHCHQSTPVRAIKNSIILKHAATIYTQKIYKLFEKEYLDGCGATNFQETPCGGTLYKYEIMLQSNSSKNRVVYLDTSTLEVNCSCKQFVTLGYLCSHALVAFNLKNITQIPPQYILRRWTMDARKRVFKLSEDKNLVKKGSEAEILFRNRTMRFAYDLVSKSQEDMEARRIVLEGLEGISKSLESHFLVKDVENGKLLVKDDEKEKLNNDENETRVLDPYQRRPKGAPNSRMRGHFEKPKKKTCHKNIGQKSIRKDKDVLPATQEQATPIVTQAMEASLDHSHQTISTMGVNSGNMYMPNFSYSIPNHASQLNSSMHGGGVFMPNSPYPLCSNMAQLNSEIPMISWPHNALNVPCTPTSQEFGWAPNISNNALDVSCTPMSQMSQYFGWVPNISQAGVVPKAQNAQGKDNVTKR